MSASAAILGEAGEAADETRPNDAMPELMGPQAPSLPPAVRRHDYVLAVFIAASLVVHLTAILPSLINWDEPPHSKVQHEVPVELVQAPPEPPKPKPKPQAQAAPKPAPKAEKPAPKADKPKPVAKAQQVKRQEAAKRQDSPKPHEAAKPKEPPKPQLAKIEPKTEPKPAPPAASGADRLRQLLGMPPPGMDARALPGASGDGTESVSYAQLVLSQVAKAKKEGKFRGTPGAASVAFLVGDKGEVLNVEIKRPSGDPSLDQEAVAMIHRAAPFPPPPPGGRRDYVVTLVFRTI